MKLAWCSDLHLNFIGEAIRREFYRTIDSDVVVISGDIAESHNVVRLIKEMQDFIEVPVYFVLGNHDFYGSSVAKVKEEVKKLDWLSNTDGIPLTDHTILMGVDGWGDCREGDFEHSRLSMADWIYIEELQEAVSKGRPALKKMLQLLADKDAKTLASRIKKAIKNGFENIIVTTHVPPFEEACLYAGKKSTDCGLPFFASQILGSTVLPIAEENPTINITWLSGHTHSRATYQPCKNLLVRVADAQYCFPKVEDILYVG